MPTLRRRASVLLDDLDKELEQRGHRFARYADDFVILTKSQRAGERVMASVRRFLEDTLKLKVNETKSAVVKASELTFLGFAFKGGRIVWSEKSFRRFEHEVRKLTSRRWGVAMSMRIRHLAQYLRGWMGYYGISRTYAVVRHLEHWIRRRLRCCYWFRAKRQDRARSEPEQMWKTRRNRICQLLRRGVAKRDAILNGLSGSGCWAMSKSPALNQALHNDWLTVEGVPRAAEALAKECLPSSNSGRISIIQLRSDNVSEPPGAAVSSVALAKEGPARRVVWGAEANHLRLPDSAFSV